MPSPYPGAVSAELTGGTERHSRLSWVPIMLILAGASVLFCSAVAVGTWLLFADELKQAFSSRLDRDAEGSSRASSSAAESEERGAPAASSAPVSSSATVADDRAELAAGGPSAEERTKSAAERARAPRRPKTNGVGTAPEGREVLSRPAAFLKEPNDAECSSAAAEAEAPTDTQAGLNAQARARLILAECEMRRAFNQLPPAVRSNSTAMARLEDAQKAWSAFADAHDLERFPHRETEPMVYGSILPVCSFGERESLTQERTQQLARIGLCEKSSSAGEATAAARREDVALNDVYRKVRSLYAMEPVFLAAFQRAQAAWLKFRDAHIAFVGSISGGPDSACAQRELERVVRARTQEMGLWLKPADDVSCNGSYGPPP